MMDFSPFTFWTVALKKIQLIMSKERMHILANQHQDGDVRRVDPTKPSWTMTNVKNICYQ